MSGSNHQIQLNMSIFTMFLEMIPLFHKVQTCNSMVDITQTGIDIPPWKVYKYIYINIDIRTKSVVSNLSGWCKYVVLLANQYAACITNKFEYKMISCSNI